MNRKKKIIIIIYKKKRDNLHFIPNNILTKFFKELIKYINDYQQQAKMAKKKKISNINCWQYIDFRKI